MNVQEKLAVVRESIRFSNGGCLDCLARNPETDIDDRDANLISAYSPSDRQIQGVVRALHQVGLTAEEVDAFTATKKRIGSFDGTRLSKGNIGGCIDPKTFLRLIEDLLRKKEGEQVPSQT